MTDSIQYDSWLRLANTGSLERGMSGYRRAEAIFETLSAADPKDLESLRRWNE